MPAVVTFWQLPEEEQEFLEFLQTTGKVVAVPNRWVKTKEEFSPKPIVEYISCYDPDALQFGFADQILQAVEAREFDGELLFGLSPMKPNVIGYSRGKIRNGKLAQSNLAAYWDYPDDKATCLIKKDDAFVKWAKKVLSWARKATPDQIEYNGFPYRATRRAYEAVTAGKLEAVP